MNRIYATIITVFCFFTSNAQVVTANDSVNTGAANTQMVFYSLSTGAKTVVSNTDWHVAISVRPTQYPNNTLGGTTVRINEAMGVKAYQIPNFTQDSVNVAVDTAGYHNWLPLHDSDTLLDLGAFNNGYNIGQFFYGWGLYTGQPLHNVVGKKVYLVELPDGSVKKFFINKVVFDTAWVIDYSNIDNSNPQTFSVSKHTYAGKELVYLNLIDNSVKDKEPISSDWDIQFLKYAARDVYPGLVHEATGVWTNQSGSVAKVTPVDVTHNSGFDTLHYSADLNAIGWNWKEYTLGDSMYHVLDSLAYFVHTNAGAYYKIIFTDFGGSATGVISFYKELVGGTSGIKETPVSNLILFPNPAANQLTIEGSQLMVKEVRVFDVYGNQVAAFNPSVTGHLQLDISSLQSGAYILNLRTSDGVSVNEKFLIAR